MNKEVESVLDTFFSAYPKVKYSDGDKIIDSYEDIKYIYYLKEGNVKQTYISEEGNEMFLHVFKPVSFFPFMLGISNTPNQYVFTAINEVNLYKAPLEDVVEFVKEEPDVLFDLTTRFASGINGMLNRITTILYSDAMHRIVNLLLYLSDNFGRDIAEGRILNIALTHEEIASWIGATRETVSRNLEKLQKEHIIATHKKAIIITNKNKLKNLVH